MHREGWAQAPVNRHAWCFGENSGQNVIVLQKIIFPRSTITIAISSSRAKISFRNPFSSAQASHVFNNFTLLTVCLPESEKGNIEVEQMFYSATFGPAAQLFA